MLVLKTWESQCNDVGRVYKIEQNEGIDEIFPRIRIKWTSSRLWTSRVNELNEGSGCRRWYKFMKVSGSRLYTSQNKYIPSHVQSLKARHFIY